MTCKIAVEFNGSVTDAFRGHNNVQAIFSLVFNILVGVVVTQVSYKETVSLRYGKKILTGILLSWSFDDHMVYIVFSKSL